MKVELSLGLIKYRIMTYGEVEVKLHISLTLALDEGEWSASISSCFASV